MKEFDLIQKYFYPLTNQHPAALALKDDAAVIAGLKNADLVVSTDTCCSGIHFPIDTPPEMIARRALRISLSDLVAMGAQPYGYFLSLSLPAQTKEAWVKAFSKGLKKEQALFSLALLGGDTTASLGPLTVAITVLGQVKQGGALHRSTAKADDLVFITDTVGDAALGLKILQRKLKGIASQEQSLLLKRFYLPPLHFGFIDTVSSYVHAAIDSSDGLVASLHQLAKASSLKAEVSLAAIPFSKTALKLIDKTSHPLSMQRSLMTAGDDYNLILAVPPKAKSSLIKAAQKHKVLLTEIGRLKLLEKPLRRSSAPFSFNVEVKDAQQRKIAFTQKGYEHTF